MRIEYTVNLYMNLKLKDEVLSELINEFTNKLKEIVSDEFDPTLIFNPKEGEGYVFNLKTECYHVANYADADDQEIPENTCKYL